MYFRIIIILFLMPGILPAAAQQDIYASKTNASYNQKIKKDSAVIFAEGIITTPDDEFGGTISPDGKTCYFTKSVIQFYIDVICFFTYRKGKNKKTHKAPYFFV